MAASLQSAATFLKSAKISTAPSHGSAHLRSTQTVGKSFGLEFSYARLTCSFQSNFKDLDGKCSDAVKIAGFALATSAPVVSGASAEGAPKRLTYDEIQSKTYMEVKGTGTANQCPTINGGSETFSFKPGKYVGKKFCFEPTSFTVKADSLANIHQNMAIIHHVILVALLVISVAAVSPPATLKPKQTVPASPPPPTISAAAKAFTDAHNKARAMHGRCFSAGMEPDVGGCSEPAGSLPEEPEKLRVCQSN